MGRLLFISGSAGAAGAVRGGAVALPERGRGSGAAGSEGSVLGAVAARDGPSGWSVGDRPGDGRQQFVHAGGVGAEVWGRERRGVAYQRSLIVARNLDFIFFTIDCSPASGAFAYTRFSCSVICSGRTRRSAGLIFFTPPSG